MFEIKTPNPAAYFYILWPVAIVIILTASGNTFGLGFSTLGIIKSIGLASISFLFGILWLNISIVKVKYDLVNEINKSKGLMSLKH